MIRAVPRVPEYAVPPQGQISRRTTCELVRIARSTALRQAFDG